jgi:RecJ-like exonuclease
MADEDEDIGDDEDAESYSYDYSADEAGNGPAADCADCGGTGKVQLLFAARPCEKCGGTGKVDAGQDVSCEPLYEWVEPAPGCWLTEYTYDEQGDLVGQREWPVPDVQGPDAPPAV